MDKDDIFGTRSHFAILKRLESQREEFNRLLLQVAFGTPEQKAEVSRRLTEMQAELDGLSEGKQMEDDRDNADI